MQPRTGTILAGRYRLERRLGAGASASVWLAFDAVLERQVAVKVLAEDHGGVPDKLERFRREARALAQLGHPHIVTVIDTGEHDGTPFIVLEHVPGETLKQRIRRAGPLPIDEAIAYAIEIARALAAAHEHGIVHRDVKSQNILLDPEGGAKLSDFGIARSGGDSALTQNGRVLGTTDYVSPEQALGQEAGDQSDIYSLGVVLYESLTGAVPFSGSSRLAVATLHVRAQMPDVQRSRGDVSAALAAVIDHATAKRLDRRYGDARAMVADLERALAIQTARAGDAGGEASTVLRTLPQAARSRLPLRVRHRSATALSVAAVVLVLGAVAAFALARIHGDAARPRTVHTVEQRVRLSGATATSYNPFGSGGADNAALAPLAIAPQALDGRPGEGWATNRYAGGELRKPGVGVYVTLRHPLAANRLTFTTTTPGFAIEVWAANRIATVSAGATGTLTALGWQRLGELRRARGGSNEVALDRPASAYRYYLAWITRLEPGAPDAWVSARIGAISLSRATRRR